MVHHSVLFKLKYVSGGEDEKKFLRGVDQLSDIPGVQDLHIYRQTNKSNNFDFGITMSFATYKDYEAYNKHPDHLAFIADFWIPGAAEFLEIDYEPIPR